MKATAGEVYTVYNQYLKRYTAQGCLLTESGGAIYATWQAV